MAVSMYSSPEFYDFYRTYMENKSTLSNQEQIELQTLVEMVPQSADACRSILNKLNLLPSTTLRLGDLSQLHSLEQKCRDLYPTFPLTKKERQNIARHCAVILALSHKVKVDKYSLSIFHHRLFRQLDKVDRRSKIIKNTMKTLTKEQTEINNTLKKQKEDLEQIQDQLQILIERQNVLLYLINQNSAETKTEIVSIQSDISKLKVTAAQTEQIIDFVKAVKPS